MEMLALAQFHTEASMKKTLTGHLRVFRLEFVPLVPLCIAWYDKLEGGTILARLLNCHNTLDIIRRSLATLKYILRFIRLRHDLQKVSDGVIGLTGKSLTWM